jgi:SLT domain-containing protein
MAVPDTSLLQAALIGYQMEADKVASAIQHIQKRLGKRTSKVTAPALSNGRRKRHTISAEGRARIAAAQRKRWAAARRNKLKTMTAGG